MGIKIWLDDLRKMPPGYDIQAFTSEEAIAIITHYNIDCISFDHDLGDEEECGNGYAVAKFIEELAFKKLIKPIKCQIHSSNPCGAKNIIAAITSANKFWGCEGNTIFNTNYSFIVNNYDPLIETFKK